MSAEESHWRDMGIKMGLKMRKAPRDPLHKMSIKEKMQSHKRFRGKEQVKMAFLTPH